MLHRNVFFLGEDLPANVISAFDAADEWELFDQLDAMCPPGEAGPDCEYVTIPHNPNLSDGMMFQSPILAGDAPATVAQVRQRARADVLVEVFNHKGQSECQPGFASPLSSEEDSACTMENFKPVCTGEENDVAWCRQECTMMSRSAQRDPVWSAELNVGGEPVGLAMGGHQGHKGSVGLSAQ